MTRFRGKLCLVSRLDTFIAICYLHSLLHDEEHNGCIPIALMLLYRVDRGDVMRVLQDRGELGQSWEAEMMVCP
jgi:hypothetical protein